METIRERLQSETAQNVKERVYGKAVVFPSERVSRFRNEKDELSYRICAGAIINEESDLFDRVLEA